MRKVKLNKLIKLYPERQPWTEKLCIVIVTILLCLVLEHFGMSALARLLATGIVLIGFTVVTEWHLKRHPWFWITMFTVALSHVPMVALFAMRYDPVYYLICIPPIIADFCLLWILSVVANFAEAPRKLPRRQTFTPQPKP